MCGGTSGRTTVGVPNSFKKVLHLALFMIQNLKCYWLPTSYIYITEKLNKEDLNAAASKTKKLLEVVTAGFIDALKLSYCTRVILKNPFIYWNMQSYLTRSNIKGFYLR